MTLSAVVIPLSATGTVTFQDGSTTIGTITLSGGIATLTTSTLTALGTHSITATYNGDSAYSPSTSAPFNLLVNPPRVTVSLTASPNPATFGQTVTLMVTVRPASATGTVTVFDGTPPNSIIIGAAVVSNGIATLTTSSLKVGSHSLQASYSGDPANLPGQSTVFTEIITPATTATTLSVAPASSSLDQTVTLTGDSDAFRCDWSGDF